MPAIFEALHFTNLAAQVYYFVPNDHQRVTRFAPSVSPRGSDTGRMQAHGFNPRRTLFDGVVIQHEGKFLGADAAELIAEHDAMLAKILGDLTTPPADTKLGTLTFRYAGWSEAASADVTLDSWSWDLSIDSVRTSPYMLSWKCFDPVFIGDDTDAVKHP